jgi:phage/plasmid-like protein (TIGR03299 family)
MSTTFDGSGATKNQGSMTRTVCQKTLRVSHADKRALVTTRHNTAFNAKKVGEELATLAKGFADYKAIGDAMAQTEMAAAEVSEFFKTLLDIPFDAKKDDVSTRKLNQFADLNRAYRTTSTETDAGTVWTALNAITRYVDHDRSARTDGGTVTEDHARFASAQFGSGDTMKGKAMELLLPRVKDRVLIAA